MKPTYHLRLYCIFFLFCFLISQSFIVTGYKSTGFRMTSAEAAPRSKRSRKLRQKRKRKRTKRKKRKSNRRKSSYASTKQIENDRLPLYSALGSTSNQFSQGLPWSGLLEAHPRFIQAERLESTRGQALEGEAHPCTYQGVLKDDTCIAFNWGATGFLKNPVALMSTDTYKTRESKNPKRARNYGVPEMVAAIKQAVSEVNQSHPNTKRLVIGDLSRLNGGYFPPHLSHQSGRDADIGYYTKGSYQPEYLQKIGPRQLDVERTWTFLHSFLRDDKVKYVFMDHRLQRPLYRYLKNELKLSPSLLNKYISYPRRKGGIIRHLKGHADHMHIRFYAPQSLEGGKAYLRKHGTKVVKPVPVYYRIRRGDNLIKIARRFRIKWTKLMKWNRLNRRKARRLRAGKRLVVGYRTPPLP